MAREDDEKREYSERLQSLKALSQGHMKERIDLLWELHDDMQDELIELAITIREGQERKVGAVTLDLQRCKQKGCAGCPHARWLKWVSRKSKNPNKKPEWFGTKISQPRRHARSATFSEDVRFAIARAEYVLKQRASLMEKMKAITNTIKWLEANRFEDQDEMDEG